MNPVLCDEEMVAKAVAGDHAALESLLIPYHGPLLAHVTRLIPSKVRASVCPDDVLQQTYLNAFRSIGRFESRGEGAFYGWLKVIAERQLMDACRKRDREQLSEKPAHSPPGGGGNSSLRGLLSLVAGDEPIPGDQAMLEEMQAEFQVALARMPENYRQVLVLRYLEDLPLEDVAEKLGLSEGSVRGLCHRARQHLRDELMRLSRFI
ncbi:MAG: RNA polymerase sigma factor [Pirellulales bacterium]